MSGHRTLLVVALLLLVAVATTMMLATYRRTPLVPTKVRDISGGATIQRNRIDRFIEDVTRMDIETAIRSLNQNGEAFGLVLSSSLIPSSTQKLYVNQILGDRRVSLILEHLLALPQKDAATEAANIFDSKLNLLVECWHLLANGKSKELAGRMSPAHHAASASLFLCSCFCSPSELDQKIRNWDEVFSREFSHVQGIRLSAHPNGLVDLLLRLNLKVISGNSHGASIDDLNQRLDILLRNITGESTSLLQLSALKFYRRNAETMPTDFTHITRGVPVSEESVLLSFPGFSNPNAKIIMKNDQVFSELEREIDHWSYGIVN